MAVHLETRGIRKTFGYTVANDGISVSFVAGRIHALVGENGAGKTTFLDVLSGLYKPDEGEILLDGQNVRFKSPKDAIKRGIYLVQQNFSLIENFSVAENLAILRGSSLKLLNLDEVSVPDSVQLQQSVLQLDIRPTALVKDLPLNFRQRLEVYRGLMYGADVLLLDEPTSVLSPQQAEELEKNLRALANRGKTICITSHKLEEIARMADDFTVLRHGKVIFSGPKEKIASPEELVRHMFGGETFAILPRREKSENKVLLETKNIVLRDKKTNRVIVDSVGIRAEGGQILGIAGIAGNGQKELAEALVGLYKVGSGKIFFAGTEITKLQAGEIRRLGVNYIPEEGAATGLVPDFTIAENFMLTTYDMLSLKPANNEQMRKRAAELIQEFGINPPDADCPARQLSGGNAQKLILARELSRPSRMLVSYNPTKGLDVKTKTSVHQKHLEKRNSGSAVLLISEDLDEIMSLSDEVAVMLKGRIVFRERIPKTNILEVGRKMTSAE